MTETPLFALKDLSFSYPQGKARVLEGLNLSLLANQTLAILGPNGSGKSTLLNLLLGWLKPKAGSLLLKGKTHAQYSRRELGKAMALVPQNEPVSFEFSALDFVMFGRAPYLSPLEAPGEADYQIGLGALEKVGLAGLEDRSVLAMSGGEKQLLLIARALAQESQTILLDEPSSHLDLGNKARMAKLLRDLAAEGHTLILTTHEPELALALAERTLMLKEGKLLYDGLTPAVINTETLSELYQSPVDVVNHEGTALIRWDSLT